MHFIFIESESTLSPFQSMVGLACPHDSFMMANGISPAWRRYFPGGSVVLFVNIICFFSHFLYHVLLIVSCGILLKTVAHFVNWDYVVTLKFFLEKQNKGFKTPLYLIQFQSKTSTNNKDI